MRDPLTRRNTPIALALAALTAACSDLGTESFDPMGSSEKAQQAYTAIGSNTAVRSLDALDGAFSWTGAPAVLPAGPAAAPASPADILPPAALGKTFVYSTQTGKYTASDQTGAPSNGARFLLYQVDPVTNAVIQPLVVIGFLDLTNESSPQPNTLGIKAVVNTVTLLDYKANGSLVGGTLSISGKGMVSDGTGRLDFDLSQNYTQATGLKIDYKVTAATPDLTIQVVAADPPGTGITTTLTVTEGRNKLEITADGTTSSVTGEVNYNGHKLATISGSGTDPVFTGQGNRQLSAQEIDGLKALFDFVDELFDGIDNLLIPAYFGLFNQ